MTRERLSESLQEAVLAVLAFDDHYGGLVASQVTPENFDGIYAQIAAPVLNYRRKYQRAPGEAHLESLFSRAKLDPSDRRTHALRRTLVNLANYAEAVNAEYIASRTQDFVRAQKLKAALLAANERYAQGGDDAIPEVEGILSNALKFRQTTLDAGSFLSDVDRMLEFNRTRDDYIALGIPQLDSLGIGMYPKQLLLMIAPKGSGKTHFCVHCGRQAVMQKLNTLHVSLEMDEPRVLSRYYQTFFGVARRPGAFNRAAFDLDELDRFVGIRTKKIKPKLDFTNPEIRKILRNKVKRWGARFDRLVVKSFSSGTLTMSQLRGYLDFLELHEKFVPNVLIVDYPRLMRQDPNNLRITLGQTIVDLRGLADERNMAVVAPAQSNREGIGARRVTSRNTSEDISTVFTADTVLSYSQTEAEKLLGLARLTVEHARDEETGLQILLSQSYATGQYIADSAVLNSSYWDVLKDLTGEEAVEPEE